MTLDRKSEAHGQLVVRLGDRLLNKYTDGGAGRTRDKRKAKAAKQARKKNRGR